MNRKRLISILSGMTLSLAALTGPAFAADLGTSDEETVNEDGANLDLEVAKIELERSESKATLKSGDETITVSPTDEEPVKTTVLESDGGDGGDDGEGGLTDPVGEVLDGGEEPSDPDPGPDDGGTDGGKVKSADNDTVAAPSPYQADYGITQQHSGNRTFAHHRSYATQRPAPASTVGEPEVAEPAELSPEVAPPRADDETEVVNLASSPISDPASGSQGLKIVAALLVAGTALSWWNAREAVVETSP